MRFLFVWFIGLFGLLSTYVDGKVPEPIKRSAMEAVEKLGNDIRIGNMNSSIARMYPRWKKAMSKRVGGIGALTRQLQETPKKLQEAGVIIEQFTTEPVQFAYEVNPKTLIKESAGGEHMMKDFQTWLVFVPTRMILRIPDPKTGINHRIESRGYQIAISEKSYLDWTFINGTTLKLSDLRSLFPSLPTNIPLPSTSQKEIK